MTEVRQFLIQTIQEVCRPERPDLSDHDRPLLTETLDSLDFASVLLAIEEEYQISIAEADVEGLNSINRLVAFVESHRKP